MRRLILFLVLGVRAVALGSPLDAALVAQYHFDEYEGATVFRDSSFSGNDATCSGGTCPVSGELGLFNSAARFDGTTDVVVAPDNINLDNTSTLSIQTWFFPTTVDGQADGIVSKRTGANANQSYTLFLYTGNALAVDMIGSGDRIFTTTTFSTNRWYHVTVVYNGSLAAANRLRVYINGAEDPGSPFSESTASIPNYPSPLHIGMMNSGYGNGFHGLIDEVSIYNAVLSDEDVRDAWERGRWRVEDQWIACGRPGCDVTDGAFRALARLALGPLVMDHLIR